MLCAGLLGVFFCTVFQPAARLGIAVSVIIVGFKVMGINNLVVFFASQRAHPM